MPYQINRHAHNMLWVTMQGHMAMDHAERYFQDMWRTLDDCPRPTDLIVDGRLMQGANNNARQRTEQIIHHPHLGHIAFVVGSHHLLLFAPLVKFVSGVGLFGNEHEALSYLGRARGTPTIANGGLPMMPPRPQEVQQTPPPPQSGMGGLLDSWTNGLRQISRSIERD
ncbi:hypothetical protein [Oscillochloris sp. ZM17-4]|uniref:hypothetical protein n=1 Tax=Oscillochloris sp. ZM17-4 TaxID=2866714 RepID=UPI002102606D|nr:hypothetical protein [Oscillochloris sp. ZM17-4]